MKKLIVTILFIFLFSIFLFAEDNPNNQNNSSLFSDDLFTEGFKFIGQYKNYISYQKQNDFVINYNNDGTPHTENYILSDLKRIRLSPEIKYGNMFVFHLDYDNELIMTNFNRSPYFNLMFRPSTYNEFSMLTWDVYSGDSIFYRHKIHRAYMKLSINSFTFTIGRQQIRFGSAIMWNPLDIFNPISPVAIEGAEEQASTDALRINYYLNDQTEIALIINPKRYKDNFDKIKCNTFNFAARFKTTINLKNIKNKNFGSTDLALLVAYAAKRKIIATDFSTVLFKGLLKGSVLHADSEGSSSFLQSSIGFDRSFKNSMRIAFEYFYNQDAVLHNDSLMQSYNTLYNNGITSDNYYPLANRIITMNHHFGGLLWSYELSSLFIGSILIMYEFANNGLMVTPSVNYSYSDNVTCFIGSIFSGVFSKNKRRSDFYEYHGKSLVWMGLKLFF